MRTGAQDTEAFRDVDLMLFDKVIAFDNFRQKIILIANMRLDEAEAGYNRAVMELKQMASLLRDGEKKQEPGGHLAGEVTPLFDRDAYCGMVEKQNSISARETFSRSSSPTASPPPLREAFSTPTGCSEPPTRRPTCSTSPAPTWRWPGRRRKPW